MLASPACAKAAHQEGTEVMLGGKMGLMSSIMLTSCCMEPIKSLYSAESGFLKQSHFMEHSMRCVSAELTLG